MKFRRWLIGGLLLMLFGACFVGEIFLFPLIFAFQLAFGWIPFAWRAAMHLSPDGVSLAVGGTALLLFGVGAHWFMWWLQRERSSMSSNDSQAASPAWRPRWTLGLAGVLLAFFVAGVAGIGVTHQAAWLATMDEPIFVSSIYVTIQRVTSINQARFLALSSYDSAKQKSEVLPHALAKEHGKLLHGWMTQVLPYLELQELHGQIDFGKTWNHPSNQIAFQTSVPNFLATRSLTYLTGEYDETGYALTHYAGNPYIHGRSAVRLDEIGDGKSNTLLLGEAFAGAKPWGSPTNWRDPSLPLNSSPRAYNAPWAGGGVQFATTDNRVLFLNDDIDPKILRALATPNGGEDARVPY